MIGVGQHRQVQRLTRYIISADPMQRTAFLAILISMVTTQYAVWALLMYQWPYAHQYLNPDVIGRYMPIGFGFVAGSLGFYLLARWLTGSGYRRLQSALQTGIAIFYVFNMCFFGYLIGSMSMAAGAVFLGSPIFGLFLLEGRAIYIGLAVALVTLLLLGMLSAHGVIEYAPLLLNGVEPETSSFWFWSMMFFILPYWLVVCGLCDFIIKHLRQREADIRYLAEHDALTHLYNRHYLDSRIGGVMQRCAQRQQVISVLLLDLDHFKQINDQFGHLSGDQVLTNTARTLEENMRPTDILCRFGGEEFLILLLDTQEADALKIAERIRLRLSEMVLHDAQGMRIPVSASIGLVSCLPIENTAFNHLVGLADQALYQAKAAGRNRVVVYR